MTEWIKQPTLPLSCASSNDVSTIELETGMKQRMLLRLHSDVVRFPTAIAFRLMTSSGLQGKSLECRSRYVGKSERVHK